MRASVYKGFTSTAKDLTNTRIQRKMKSLLLGTFDEDFVDDNFIQHPMDDHPVIRRVTLRQLQNALDDVLGYQQTLLDDTEVYRRFRKAQGDEPDKKVIDETERKLISTSLFVTEALCQLSGRDVHGNPVASTSGLTLEEIGAAIRGRAASRGSDPDRARAEAVDKLKKTHHRRSVQGSVQRTQRRRAISSSTSDSDPDVNEVRTRRDSALAQHLQRQENARARVALPDLADVPVAQDIEGISAQNVNTSGFRLRETPVSNGRYVKLKW